MTLTRSRKYPATKSHLREATIEHTSPPPHRPRIAHKVISGLSAPLPTPEILCEAIPSGITALDDAVARDMLEWKRVATESHEQGGRGGPNDPAGLSAGANYQKARF